jgi:predicted transcriptional regulator
LEDDESPAYRRKASSARKGVERQAFKQNFSFHGGGITSGSNSASR